MEKVLDNNFELIWLVVIWGMLIYSLCDVFKILQS